MRLLPSLLLFTLLSSIPVLAVPISGGYFANRGYQNNSEGYFFNLGGDRFSGSAFPNLSGPFLVLSNYGSGPVGVPVPFSYTANPILWSGEVSSNTYGLLSTGRSLIYMSFNTPAWEGGTVTREIQEDRTDGILTNTTYIDTVVGGTAPISGTFRITYPLDAIYNPVITPLTTDQGRGGSFSGTFTGTATIDGRIYFCEPVSNLPPGYQTGCQDNSTRLFISFSGELIEDAPVTEPIPEPATCGSIGAGLGVLYWFRARSRRS